MWERACSRSRQSCQHQRWLVLRYREQARSHRCSQAPLSWHLRQFLRPQIKHQHLGILAVAQRQCLFLAHSHTVTFL